MDENKQIIPISDAAGKALLARLESGEEIDLTAEERAYLIQEMSRERQAVKNLLVDQLMVVNTMSQESRAQEEQEVAAGLRDQHQPDAYDALDKAIADTAVYISNIDESLIDDLASFQGMHTYLIEKSNKAPDYYEYEGYQALARYFSS